MADRDLFTDAGAEIYKRSAGKPWRPSNGFEGDLFTSAFCSRCKHGVACDIFLLSLGCGLSDPDYPSELVISDRGQPTCTAFAEKTDG
jgi:hypothetical protein